MRSKFLVQFICTGISCDYFRLELSRTNVTLFIQLRSFSISSSNASPLVKTITIHLVTLMQSFGPGLDSLISFASHVSLFTSPYWIMLQNISHIGLLHSKPTAAIPIGWFLSVWFYYCHNFYLSCGICILCDFAQHKFSDFQMVCQRVIFFFNTVPIWIFFCSPFL